MIAPIEQQEELNNRVDKDGCRVMSPFVADVERASNVRMYNPKCETYPYNGETK